jgi:hypothetical protein
VAVISDGLSFSIFQSLNTVGNEFKLNGLRYKIVGVYNRNALFTFLTSDGYDDIYIPTGSDADRIYGTDTAVQSILAAPPEDVPVSFTEKAITDALLNVSGNAGNYLSRDFTSAATVIRQFMRIEIFITVLLLYVLVIKGFIKDVAKQKDVELTRKLVFSLKWLIVALGCLLAYRFAAFELYINPRFISSVRLLDFEFYWSMIKNAAQERNLYYAYVPPLFERLYNYALVFNALCFVLYCVILKPLSRRRGAIRNED